MQSYMSQTRKYLYNHFCYFSIQWNLINCSSTTWSTLINKSRTRFFSMCPQKKNYCWTWLTKDEACGYHLPFLKYNQEFSPLSWAILPCMKKHFFRYRIYFLLCWVMQHRQLVISFMFAAALWYLSNNRTCRWEMEKETETESLDLCTW